MKTLPKKCKYISNLNFHYELNINLPLSNDGFFSFISFHLFKKYIKPDKNPIPYDICKIVKEIGRKIIGNKLRGLIRNKYNVAIKFDAK